MMGNWIQCKVGDFVEQVTNQILLVPSDTYTLLGMSLEGRGLFVREHKKGSEIGSKSLNKLQSGLFIYSRLFAWKGAFDFVTDEFDGLYVSDEYPTFKVDDKKADVRFLHYYFNQAKTWKAVEQFCIGVTKASRNRFKEKFFLDFPISLPDLPTQKKIVSRIEALEQKKNLVCDLMRTQTKEINNLLFSKYTDIIKNTEWLSMKKIAPIHRRQLEVDPHRRYSRIGVRSFGRGLFENPSFMGSELTWQKIFRMNKGDLLFSNANGWEGAVGLIPEKYDGWVGSHRYITCLPNLFLINPKFLFYYFTTNEGVAKLSQASPGTVARTRTLNTKLLMQIEVPIPTLELQNEFVELLEKTRTIKEQYKQIEQELTELMPSVLDKEFGGELLPSRQVKIQNGISMPVQEGEIKLPFAASYKNNDLELAMIVALMESKLGNTYGEVGIQKTVFNIEAFNPALSKKYDFVNYHFGTYSAELKEGLKSNPLLGKRVIRGNEVFTVSATHKKTVLNAISDKANVNFVMSVNQLLDVYTSPFIGKHTDKIELLNTVTKLIIDLQTSEVNTIYEGMKKWHIQQQGFKTKADKFSLADTSKTLELLKSLALIDKLIR